MITGAPTQSGDFAVVLKAANAVGTGSAASVTIRINPNTLPVVTSTPALAASPATTGTVGSNITAIQINATNAPILANGYSATGLPPGLSLNANTGQITGAPTLSGDFAVVLKAANAAGTGSAASVTLRINPAAIPVISSAASVSANENQPFAGYQIIASNLPILANGYNATGLPTGLALDRNTGAITGTPTVSGPFSATVTATNVVGTSGNFVVSFTITPTSVPTVTAALQASPAATGTVGTAIAPIRINATNLPISAYVATGLPAGLTVNVSGQIVGTPTQSGDFAVVLSATNAAGTGSAAPVTIRINPNIVPVISGANTASGSANAAFTGYQINASNAPILANGYSASGLPPGLTLNQNTGAITGIPNASGTFAASLSAANAAGTSAPFALTFTINPSTTPGITSPTFASLVAGTAISPIQIVATNLPILANGYAASGLPNGLTVNAATGVISGTPSVPGAFSATLTATNVVGPGSRIVQFTIGIPAPGACAMAVPLNTPTTLDLASCVFSGFSPTGVTLVATAAHGAALANGTKVIYTPVHNYFGADSFSFVATGAAGTSPQGVVAVTVTGRPDPTQDVAVAAVAAAQAETSQRFARAQVSNFQRRMESLHRGIATTVQGEGALQGSVPSIPASGFGSTSGAAVPATVLSPSVFAQSQAQAQIQAANAVGAALAMPRTIGSEILASNGNMPSNNALQAPVPATQAEVLNAIVSGTGLRSLPFADSVFSLLKSRSLNLSGVASGFGLNSPNSTTGNTSYWVEGVASFGTRDASGGFSGSEFNSSGVSVGADRRFSDEWVLGMGLGYARDTTKIGTDGSSNRSRGYSLAVYGSYQPSPNTFVDGLLGVGTVDFDTTRYVAPINDFALGQRSGTQVFGSLTGGYEFRDKALLVSPYARIDFSSSRLRDSTESGAGAYALTYFGQTMNSVQGALGIRGESVHATDFGYAVPKLRAEYLHEFQGTGQAFFGYADQIGGPRYALASAGTGRNAIVLGIGSDFLMRDGLTLAFEYQLSRSSAHDSSYALRLRLTKEFDAQGLPKLLGEYPVRIGKPLDIQLDVGYTNDDNVTRAKSGPDKLSDDSYSLNVSKTIISPLSEQSRLLLTGTLGGEKFHHFNGLSRVQGSAEAELQYRESSDFDDPTFAAFAKLTGEEYETRLRDGYRLSAGVSIRQALTDRINVFGALSRNVRNASSSVFSTRDSSARINFDYALSDRQTLYLSGEYRRGDIVSTGHASLENVSIAKVFAQDDAYAGGQLFSYRFDGSTVLATLGFNLVVGAKDSIDFSWRYVRSTPGLRPSFVTSPRNYIANQLSAVYLMRF